MEKESTLSRRIAPWERGRPARNHPGAGLGANISVSCPTGAFAGGTPALPGGVLPRLLRSVLALSLLLLSAAPATAHQYRGMSTHVTIESTGVQALVRLAHQDIVLLAPRVDRNRDGNLSPEEFERGQEQLVQATASSFLVADSGQTARFTTGSATITGEGIVSGNIDELLISLAYEPADGTSFSTILINPNLFRDVGEISPISGQPILNSPKNLVTILDQGQRVVIQATGTETYETTIGLALASAGGESGTGGPTARKTASLPGLMATFLWEGIIHILLGWDHIFFVLGLVLLAARFIDLLKVITAFTLAHSITLILTALDVIPIRSPSTMSLIEALIAASVAYVGIENLFRLNAPPRWRWALVFGFGLIHGFGFANVLRELLVDQSGGGRSEAVASLLMFNVGVEAGQILVLSITFPLLHYLRQRNQTAWKRVVVAGSIFVAFMGTSWVLDRTVLPDTLVWLKPFEE